MREVDQLIMIIPVVLNLKGNLEMNLSARLGTAANVGELDDPPVRRSIIVGNLALLQVQATVVSFVAAGVSLVLGLIVPRTEPDVQETLVIPRRPLPHVPQADGPRKSGFPTWVKAAFLWGGVYRCEQIYYGRIDSNDRRLSVQSNPGIVHVRLGGALSTVRPRSRFVVYYISCHYS
jgi:hypothetical protein